jgi:hypothetical protein
MLSREGRAWGRKREKYETHQEVYPSYAALNSSALLPLITSTRFSTNTGACPVMAAAVLDVGREEQSPREKMLGYVVCWSEEGETETHPAASAMV